MAESDTFRSKTSEAITITILRARNLRGQRGDTVTAQVKVEFADKSLGETPKVDCASDKPAEFNYHANLNVQLDDAFAIDEISYRPVVCTIIEILPKEKRQKEEKTVQLGQCTIDLYPLLEGKTKLPVTCTISPSAGSAIENLPPEHPKPELDVQLSVVEPLLTEGQLRSCNLLSVTVESLYAPPENWSTSGTQYHYTAATALPLTGDKENPVVFAGGVLKAADKEGVPQTTVKQKKWAVPGTAQAGAVYIQDRGVVGEEVEEAGDYRDRQDREHRQVAEHDKQRVNWNIDRRCYMDASAVHNFQSSIAKTRIWPLEIVRTTQQTASQKPKKEDEGFTFHGVAYLNLAPLLYPGVSRIRGAFKVTAYNEQEFQNKTQRRSQADDACRIATNILLHPGQPLGSKPRKEDAGKGKEAKKVAAQAAAPADKAAKATEVGADGEPIIVNAEGQQYIDAKSYVIIDIRLHHPLIHKRQKEELAQRVAEYIPPRPLYPKRTDGALRAVEDFHSQVGNVAGLILEEFRENFGDVLTMGNQPVSPDVVEQRRQKLVYQLNTSGKYFAFKEQLKYSVVKIVREKYLRTTNFTSREELEAFLSQLYVFLLDEMHVGLNKFLQVEDQVPVPAPLTDAAQLKHFAREAEVNGNFELAEKFYQERIAREKNDADHWLDYGVFCLYISNLSKAEECFRQCIAINQTHFEGLLLCGVVCSMQDKQEAAETFFESATSLQPKSLLAWTMLALYYDGIGSEIGTEMALGEAHRLNQAAAVAAARGAEDARLQQVEEEEVATDRDDGATDTAVPGDPGRTSTLSPPPSHHPAATEGKKVATKDTRKKSGTKKVGDLPTAAAAAAADEGQGDSPRPVTPTPTETIYMQIIDFLLEVKTMSFAERALAHHLLEPLGGASAAYLIALARLHMQKNQLQEAEQCLADAVQVDFQNADVWGLMGHVKYLQGDVTAAKECYERTIAFISDPSEVHSIYLRLASIYLQEAQFEQAKKTFLLACRRSPSCVSWLGVGIASYRLGEFSEAEDALCEANMLNNMDAEVWAYLSLVCLKTGRQVEAEQSYKFAVKLNLQQDDLMEEIRSVQKEVGFGNPEL